MSDGWNESAAAWIADMGERGDFTRAFVLDRPMLARVDARPFERAIDIGCGEGRFCRFLRERGIDATGVDPTHALLDEARRRDPGGDYREGRAERLAFANDSFDLAVSYLALIDVPDYRTAVSEMARVLRPGGIALVANLTGLDTANLGDGHDYFVERSAMVGWRGIRIANWHRPLAAYVSAFLENGFRLTHFDEPAPYGGSAREIASYRQRPWAMLMEWQKP